MSVEYGGLLLLSLNCGCAGSIEIVGAAIVRLASRILSWQVLALFRSADRMHDRRARYRQQ